jgi:AAA15 family ATPase/GTPase
LNSYVSDKLLNTEGEKSTLINILRKADFNISDIIIKDKGLLPDSTLKIYSAFDISGELLETIKNVPRKQIEFEHTVGNSKYFLPIEDESQGTQRYYGFAGLLSSLINRSIAIPIDEIESSLHPDLFNHFLLSFLVNSKNSQIIATTHNREILNNKDIFRDDVIWFTDKSAASATELYSLSDFDSSVIRDTSNVYNAYKTGKLGGIPHLSDYYIDNNNGQD